MTMLHVTKHAVDRFVEYWRTDLEHRHSEARQLLTQLVARCWATRIKTLPGDAWIYIAQTEQGERICLVVKDGTVVTLLDEEAGRTYGILGVLHSHAEVLRNIDRQRARLAAWVQTEHVEQEKLKAQRIVDAWRAGETVRPKALRRAKRLLGLADGSRLGACTGVDSQPGIAHIA